MKLIISESKITNLLDKYIDSLYGNLTFNTEHKYTYWVDENGETIFTYDNWDNDLYVPSEMISDMVNLFGLKYIQIREVLVDVFNQKFNLKIDKVRPI